MDRTMNKQNTPDYESSELKIKHAFMELLEEQSAPSISIGSICQKAGISRSVFYAHFLSLEDLVSEMETDLQHSLMEQGKKKKSGNPFSKDSLMSFLHYIRKNQQFYKAALPYLSSFPVRRGRDTLFKEIVQPFETDPELTDPDELEFLNTGFQAGLTTMIQRWVEQDCRTSEEQMARIVLEALPCVWG